MTPPTADRLLELERRVESDPSSLLFAPLAEMYRAAGRLLDAERVLSLGLERHPEHHSAATALGRVLLEQGRRDEARTLLEGVVARVPDNLLAVRLLSEVGPAPRKRAPLRPPSTESRIAASSSHRARVEPRAASPVPPPGDRLVSGTLADLYLEQGDWEQGIAILRELARREPESWVWAEKLRAAELERAPAIVLPEPATGLRAAPEPLPEEVWTPGDPEESDDPSTLDLFDARRLKLMRRPATVAAAPPITLDSVAPRGGARPATAQASGSTSTPLKRLRSLLARVERYRAAHAR